MGIIYKTNLDYVKKEELNELYGNTYDYYSLFNNSYFKVFAFDNDKLIGALRVISEGVETALLVDLKFNDNYDIQIKKELVKEAEKKLINKRVMIYGNKDNLQFFEDLGYGRCKNAWTYFKGNLNETDFLPPGYKYETEFITYSEESKPPLKNANIVYKDNYDDSLYDDINTILTKAFFGRYHDINNTISAFKNSQYYILAFDESKLVGIARAVSDGKKYATILNVAVLPEYQGLSIGKNLVLKLSSSIKEDIIVLNTHPGAAGFYNKLSEYRRNKYVFEKHIGKSSFNVDLERRNKMFTPYGYKFPDEYDSKE